MDIALRRWTTDDRKVLTDMCNAVERRYLTDRMPFPYTEDDADWWLRMVADHEGTQGIYRAVVVDGQVVGSVSVEKKEDVYGKDGEIGYFLNRDQWTQGVMTEAVRQILPMAFAELDLIRITGLVNAPNWASRKVLEKNGFVLEGIMKQAVVKAEQIDDLCIYGKLK